MKNFEKLSPEVVENFFNILKKRFETNMDRHKNIYSITEWFSVQAKLEANPKKLWSLYMMEKTGGEPDIIEYDFTTSEYVFFDFSPETPSGRRNVVYDKAAEDWLKEHHPDEKCNGNAVDMATFMGIQILDAKQYELLQKKEIFDSDSMSWIRVPEDFRKTGYALGGNRYPNCIDFVDISEVEVTVHYDKCGFRALLRV